MARWVFICPHCKVDFTHTEVPSDAGVFAWSAEKPKFPDGGVTAICPNCNTSHVYQRYMLAYRAR